MRVAVDEARDHRPALDIERRQIAKAPGELGLGADPGDPLFDDGDRTVLDQPQIAGLTSARGQLGDPGDQQISHR